MTPITQEKVREIVEDFVKAIKEKKIPTAKPAFAIINFRDEKRNNFERRIEFVPIGLLRYRKDNGRISSDVMNYEKLNGLLDEKNEDAQKIIKKFLEDKDPEKTEILIKSIEHSGQNEPVIITCDGFLINGNRRKMAFEKLKKNYPGDEQYATMKAVILPGPGDPGGPPTLIEIERLENRYQLQSEGKSEYFGFDRALSIKRKIDLGFSLEEQLRDDPRFARADQRELAKAVKDCINDYLKPLECIDRYLKHLSREGMYGSISSRQSDRDGRWQAFGDYSKAYYGSFKKQQWQIENNINEDDIGKIEEAAFKMIRLRTFKGLHRINDLMRNLPKFCANKDARKEILNIADEVDVSLPKEELFDAEKNPLSCDEIDAKWASKNQRALIHRTKKAIVYLENFQERETPLALLEAALKKITHENFTIETIRLADYGEARKFLTAIGKRIDEIERELYSTEKKCKELKNKK